MAHTDDAGDRLVRLPLWLGLEDRQHEVAQAVIETLETISPASAGAYKTLLFH